jgi:hypothetical protein
VDRQEPRDGVDGFIADLTRQNLAPVVSGTVVTYELVPVAGALAGQSVTTGVGVDELQSWPAAPPHWIHLPTDVAFARTHVDYTDVLPGWQRHSRDIGTWDMSRPPVLTWLAHVRGVLGEAA